MAGTVGVTMYRVGNFTDEGRKFAVFWSVPYDYWFHSNWFGLRWLADDEGINYSLYQSAFLDSSWGMFYTVITV